MVAVWSFMVLANHAVLCNFCYRRMTGEPQYVGAFGVRIKEEK